MIQANELRIGNYLYYRDKESFLEVVSLGSKFETINERGLLYGSDDIEEYNPIPLTEEILLNCDELNELLLIDKIGFVIFKNSYSYQFVIEDYKYLHQLQNLYFALTGEQLGIKL